MTLTKTNLICATLFILTIAMFSIIAIAQTNSDAKPPESQVEKISGLNARFIVALISDGNDGAWIGTEDEGVFHWQADGKVTQFTTKNGLGDNNGYALAIDARGRLWVGHLNSGVSVFNGKDWRNYDVVDGPIGERIFDIKICPKDGDVWMATSAGISRYKIEADEWEHFTREDGLLEDQASALAFLDDGTLIVGTQCHGLAIFNRFAKGVYRHKRNITAPDRFGQNNISPVPLEPSGNFFHSNLINDILVAQNAPDEKLRGVWIATSTGLIKTNNDLTKFEFWRGRDYADKVRGLWGGAPKNFKPAPKEVMDQLLPEDYLTCLAEDVQGVIWIGTRQNGFVVADQKTGQRATGTPKGLGLPDNFVTKLLLLNDGHYLIGFYGGGIVRSKKPFELVTRKPIKKPTSKIRPTFSVAQNDFKNLPSPIKPPTIDELKLLQTKLERLRTPLPKPYAAYFGEDWKTKGDWLGRTTKNWAIMCAGVSPLDAEVLMCKDYYRVEPFIGPNATANDTIRRWCHWIKTNNPNSLWDPLNGYRRQAEWDDHGESYSWAKDGPDIWYLLEIRRKGTFRLGMYFFNKDGHHGANRFRDYMIEIYPAKGPWQGDPYENWKQYSLAAEQTTRIHKPLAKSRMKDFWGGVYKQFLLSGEGYYFVKIDRNYCFNTILSAVIVERLQGEPTHEETIGIPFVSPYLPKENPYRRPPQPPKNYNSEVGWRIGRFWKKLDEAYAYRGGIDIQRKRRIMLHQLSRELSGSDAEIAQAAKAFQWQLNQWDEQQRKEWREAMESAFKTLYDSSEPLRKTIEEQKNGPPQIFLERHKWMSR